MDFFENLWQDTEKIESYRDRMLLEHKHYPLRLQRHISNKLVPAFVDTGSYSGRALSSPIWSHRVLAVG